MEPGFYGVAAVGDLVGAGVTGSVECTIHGHLKVNSAAGENAVVDEFICGQLAMTLGLPVAPGTIVQLDDGTFGYGAMLFGKKGHRPPPIDPDEFVRQNRVLAAGIVAFDVWTMNIDRHAGNLAYTTAGISIFDHERALLGPTKLADVAAHIRSIRDTPAAPYVGCLGQHLHSSSDLIRWETRIRGIPTERLELIVKALIRLDLLSSTEAGAVVEVLEYRQANLLATLQAAPLPGIDWGTP